MRQRGEHVQQALGADQVQRRWDGAAVTNTHAVLTLLSNIRSSVGQVTLRPTSLPVQARFRIRAESDSRFLGAVGYTLAAINGPALGLRRLALV